jgi:transposase
MHRARYIVGLTDKEREQLHQLVRRGKAPARRITRARVLLKADEGCTDGAIAAALSIGVSTVWRIRKRCVEEGVDAALRDRPRPGQRPKLDGKQEAHMIAVACTSPPEGHGRWTLRLLAGKVVELGFTETYSHEAVRRVLKKTNSSLGSRPNGAFPK